MLAAALLTLLGARWLTSSRYLFDNDAILYARALDHYDIRLAQPPLPGYYVYIQLGRLVRDLLALFGAGDANLALVALSALFGLLLVAALYALAAELWDRPTARIAALLALTGPIFWYQSGLASPRIAEGFFATLIVWLGARLRRRREAWVFWLLPPALALAAGVRQQSLLYLFPFCLYATWRTPWKMRLAGAALLALGLAAWATPMLQASGGLAEYRRMSDDLYQFFVVQGTGVFYGYDLHDCLRRLVINCAGIGVYTLFTCVLGLPLVALALCRARTCRLQPDTWIGAFAWQILLLATVPALLFFALIHIQQIGHALAVAPFFALLCARLLACPERLGGDGRWPGAAAAGAVVATNLAFVFFYPARLIGEQVGTPTVAAIRQHDRFVQAAIRAVRQAGSPEETLLVTSPLSFTLIEQYLPGYRYYLLPGLFRTEAENPAASYTEVLTNGKVRLADRWRRGSGCYAAPPGARRFIMVSYEEGIAAMLDPANEAARLVADAPSLVLVRQHAPTNLCFRPGYLKLVPAEKVPGAARRSVF